MTNEAFIQEVVNLTNQYRAQHGLGLLSVDIDLTEAAQTHVENMAYQDFFGHVGLDGSKPWERARQAGYESSLVGENIAAGYTTPQAVVNGWINSEGHRANLLNARYNEIGVGYFYLQNDTGKINYRTYWSQSFGIGEIEQATPAAPVVSPDAEQSVPPKPAQNTATLSAAAGLSDAEWFAALQYGASYDDLLQAFGNNAEAFWQHYQTFGQAEGRNLDRFDEVSYLASYDDLLNAFGANTQSAVQHFVAFGYNEGRSRNQFPAAQYLASHDDLITAYGYNLAAAAQHFVQWGYNEQRARDTFDEARYLASNGDLIEHFGYDLEGVTEHYIRYGMSEQRSVDAFNATAYLGRYSDLQAAFGNDLEAATRHFVEYGFEEGRVGTA